MTNPREEPLPGDSGTQDDLSDNRPVDPVQEPGTPATGPDVRELPGVEPDDT